MRLKVSKMPQGKKKFKPVDLNKVKRYSYSKRTNKTNIKEFGKPFKSDDSFFESLPNFLKAKDFNRFVKLVHSARKKNKPFHLLMGAHIIKVGLSPILIDLLHREIVTGFSFNCAGVIHDLELAFWGGTSEDVQKGLTDGSFGMVKETAELFANVVDLADDENIGLGEACGKYINLHKAKNRELSVFAAAEKIGCPVTVHVGIGTDIVAQHPEFDASKTAAASHLDFRILSDICVGVNSGGVLANIGSAVILPEVFLKALTVARNITKTKNRLTTANFDMIVHYRPMENVVLRPTFEAGEGFSFVGHHEILIPLLAWALKAKFE